MADKPRGRPPLSDDDIAAILRDDMDRTIDASLLDPDLSWCSEDFKNGYRRGFLEAVTAFLKSGWRQSNV